jgi:hypothetical protein
VEHGTILSSPTSYILAWISHIMRINAELYLSAAVTSRLAGCQTFMRLMRPKEPETLVCQPSPCHLLDLRQPTPPEAFFPFLFPLTCQLCSLVEVDINWGWNLCTFSSGIVPHSFFSPRSFYCPLLSTFIHHSIFRPRIPNLTSVHVISYIQ